MELVQSKEFTELKNLISFPLPVKHVKFKIVEQRQGCCYNIHLNNK